MNTLLILGVDEGLPKPKSNGKNTEGKSINLAQPLYVNKRIVLAGLA